MSLASQRFEEMGRSFAADPDYITHGLLCELTDDICAAMETRKLTRRELAERLGVSPQYITKFLNTPQNTTIYQAVRIAQAVGLKLDITLTPQIDQATARALWGKPVVQWPGAQKTYHPAPPMLEGDSGDELRGFRVA